MEVFVQDEAVGDSHIQKEVIYVFIKLSTFGAAAVIPS